MSYLHSYVVRRNTSLVHSRGLEKCTQDAAYIEGYRHRVTLPLNNPAWVLITAEVLMILIQKLRVFVCLTELRRPCHEAIPIVPSTKESPSEFHNKSNSGHFIKINKFHRENSGTLVDNFPTHLTQRHQLATCILNVSHNYPVIRAKFHNHPCTVCFMSMSANSVLHDISWFMWEHMGYYWLPCIKK